MRVNVGVSSWLTKRGSKCSCCFFRGAKGPLNPSLYRAAAMLSMAAPVRLNASFPSTRYVSWPEVSGNCPNRHYLCLLLGDFRYHWLTKHATLYHAFHLVLAHKNNTHLSSRLISECTKGKRTNRQVSSSV